MAQSYFSHYFFFQIAEKSSIHIVRTMSPVADQSYKTSLIYLYTFLLSLLIVMLPRRRSLYKPVHTCTLCFCAIQHCVLQNVCASSQPGGRETE